MRARTRFAFPSLLAVAAALLVASPVSAAGPGELDTSFSGDGFRTIDVGGLAEPWALFAEPNGGVTIAGERRRSYYTNNQRPRSFFARLTERGQFDTTFSDGGVRLVNPYSGHANDTPTGWDRDALGRYVVVGYLPNSNGYYLVRLKPNGRLDRSFGNNGIQTWPAQEAWGPVDVLALPDGRLIVLVGQNRMTSMRAHLADGSVDRSFGDNGLAAVGRFYGVELLSAATDRLLVAGLTRERLVVKAFRGDGSVDSNYGNRGRATSLYERETGYLDFSGAALLSDGGIALAGREVFGENEPPVLVKFDAHGHPDPALGNGKGWRRLPLTYHYFPYDLEELPGGRLAFAGYWAREPYDDDGRRPTKLFVAALQPNGDLWRPFADDGVFRSNFGNRGETIYLGTLLVTDNRLVVAATIEDYVTETAAIVIARFRLD